MTVCHMLLRHVMNIIWTSRWFRWLMANVLVFFCFHLLIRQFNVLLLFVFSTRSLCRASGKCISHFSRSSNNINCRCVPFCIWHCQLSRSGQLSNVVIRICLRANKAYLKQIKYTLSADYFDPPERKVNII